MDGALSPKRNIPQLQFAWKNARTLTLNLGHRASGGESPARLRILFYNHAPGCRAAIKRYSDDFPKYFKPGMPREGAHEGTYYYHHIHNRPVFSEMRRQRAQWVWTSFLFRRLGEHRPAESPWYPYTYATDWAGPWGRTMSDQRIQRFIEKMNQRDVGVYAYLNVTEYGSEGGGTGGRAPTARKRKQQFAEAMVRSADGSDVDLWEGTKVMNPTDDTPFWSHLQQQVQRHIDRLPGLEGMAIDRLDHASRYDYSRFDGLTMLGEKKAENMAEPVGRAVSHVAEQLHQNDKRLYVNAAHRLEVLKNVDGYAYEGEMVRMLGYLSPYRSASTWHRHNYQKKDLIRFEAQMKRRLQFAVFPQMIAHAFPISQQPADYQAASMIGVDAPLYSNLYKANQLLTPNCISVSAGHDANLFKHGDTYRIPVTSRYRFLSRDDATQEPTTVTLRVDDAETLEWAHVVPLSGQPYQAEIESGEGQTCITLKRHGIASMVIAGQGDAPPLKQWAPQVSRQTVVNQLRDELGGHMNEARDDGGTDSGKETDQAGASASGGAGGSGGGANQPPR